jgi:hypothetical protein
MRRPVILSTGYLRHPHQPRHWVYARTCVKWTVPYPLGCGSDAGNPRWMSGARRLRCLGAAQTSTVSSRVMWCSSSCQYRSRPSNQNVTTPATTSAATDQHQRLLAPTPPPSRSGPAALAQGRQHCSISGVESRYGRTTLTRQVGPDHGPLPFPLERFSQTMDLSDLSDLSDLLGLTGPS